MGTSQTPTTEVLYDNVSSIFPDVASFEMSWGSLLLFVMIDFIILFGNALVVISVLRYRFLQNATNMFVAAVATLDFLFGLRVLAEIGEELSPDLMNGRLSCIAAQIIGCTNGVANAMLLFGR